MLGVSVRILENHVDVTKLCLVVHLELPHPAHDDWFWMDQLLGLAELFDVLANPILVDKDLFPVRLGALIGQMDLQTAVEKCEFAQPIREDIELELGGDGENLGVREKGDQGAGMLFVLDFTDDFELASRFAPRKSNQVDLAVPGHLGFKPLGQGINALCADAVQTSGKFVSALSALTAGMKVGEHQFNGGHLKFRVRLDRNSASVIAYGSRAINVDGHVDLRTEAGQMFVDRVVQDFKDAVMQSAFIRIADIHPGSFPNRF